jgi:hypothetical protein
MSEAPSIPLEAPLDLSDVKMTLIIEFSFDPASGLFNAALANGARFSVASINVSGKLGENLDLLRQFVMREKGGHAPAPHVCATRPDPDAALASGKVYQPKPPRGDFGAAIAEALAAGRVTRYNSAGKQEITLEELGL